MKRIFNILLFCIISITLSSACDSLKNNKQISNKNMKNIEFIPQIFHDVELSLYSHKEYPCTPRYPEVLFEPNFILINIPQKIIYKYYNISTTPIIPACAIIAISGKRELKYHHLSTSVVHIKKVDQDTIYSGEVVDPNLKYEYPEPHPRHQEREKERIIKIQEAQKYSDKELDDGNLVVADVLNINILEYINMPFSSGRYEIYLSAFNLESNRVIVDIIIENDERSIDEVTNNHNTTITDEEDLPEI